MSRPLRLIVPAVVVLIAVVVLVRVRPLVGVLVVAVLALAVAVTLVPRWRAEHARRQDSRRRVETATRSAQVRQAELDRAIDSAATMTGPQFERLVGRLLERDGCEDVRVLGGSGDRGADVTAISPFGHRVVVQCKRYGPGKAVGDPDVQRFLGTVWHEHRAEVALFVTTSFYTRAARELGTRRGIVLVDGRRLARWMSDGDSPLPREPSEEAG
jgi:restriction system protein